jgi:hypothetical protein
MEGDGDTVRRMDQEALLELARKHLIRYASAFAPFGVSLAEGQ